MCSTTEWKNRFVVTDKNIYVIYDDKSVNDVMVGSIMPNIVNVNEIRNGNTNLVTVDFADGTSEKAVLSPEDVYSLEQGVSICLEKKLLSCIAPTHGSSLYNKLIKHAMKVYVKNRQAEEDAIAAEATEKIRAQKAVEKRRAKRERRKHQEEEREIRINTEAYKRALRELYREQNLVDLDYILKKGNRNAQVEF